MHWQFSIVKDGMVDMVCTVKRRENKLASLATSVATRRDAYHSGEHQVRAK
jgi:hypothetical protein